MTSLSHEHDVVVAVVDYDDGGDVAVGVVDVVAAVAAFLSNWLILLNTVETTIKSLLKAASIHADHV